MHSRLAFVSSLLVLGAELTRAAVNISSGCQSALLSVASSSQASCLNVVGFASVLTTPDGQSLVQPLNSWLQGACAQNLCSNDSLSAIVTNITNGCDNDLSFLGITSENTDTIITTVQDLYPTVRDIACLKTTSNDTLCTTNLLTEVESSTGQTLTLVNILSILTSLTSGGLSGLPTYITCSGCVKEAYNILQTNEPQLTSSTGVTNSLTSRCGSSFVDGSDVSGVVEGTGSDAPSGTGGSLASDAASLLSRGALTGIVLYSLAAISSAFLILA